MEFEVININAYMHPIGVIILVENMEKWNAEIAGISLMEFE